MATTASEHWHVRAPTVKIRSAVGAGDSTVGGIVAALTRGRSLREAIRYGVAAGAAAVKTAGTQLCRRDDVEELDARMAEEGQ
jgi:6-phosphofructokinase 2